MIALIDFHGMKDVAQLRVTIGSPGVLGGPEGRVGESLAIEVSEIQIGHAVCSRGQIDHSTRLSFLEIR